MRRSPYAFGQFGRPLVLLSVFVITAVGLIFVSPTSKSPADLQAPGARERSVSLVISHLIEQRHLLRHPFDNEISQRAMDQFLKGLDPMKNYFYQSDIDEFMRDKDKLDDYVTKGDLKFAYAVLDRFLERVDERVGFVDELLKQPMDFSVDERLSTDPDAVQYPKTREEAWDRWRKRIKFELLVLKNEKVEQQEAIERLSRRYHSLSKRWHQFNSDDLLEAFLTSVTSSFDPHTLYMSPSSLTDFYIQMRLNLEGIGAALMMEDGYTVVSKVIPGGAADLHGKLQPEDQIVSVGQGESGEMVDVVDMNLRDVVKLIRGKAGTIVRIGVKPAGKNEVQIYQITRAKIELKDSEARGEIIEDPNVGAHPDGTPIKIGVIDLPSFYSDMEAARLGETGYKSTTRDVRAILDRFTTQDVEVVVLDLRRNGGGSLTEAIDLTGLFIDYGPVVQIKHSDKRVETQEDTQRGMSWSGPLVVLTSKFSASASEILAGAIQDYNRGIVVGDATTHGKGTVQSLLDVGEELFSARNSHNMGALKITMQQFYRPAGDSTQKRGVVADVPLPSLTTHMDVAESDLDYSIEFDKVPPAPIAKLSFRSKSIVDNLMSRSKKRIGESEEFVKNGEKIQRYLDWKAKKFVELKEEKFLAERAELDIDKEEEKTIQEQSEDRPVVKRDFYFNEVLAIAGDYANLLQHPQLAGVRNKADSASRKPDDGQAVQIP
jgi:carboxyl-terminal processing protease